MTVPILRNGAARHLFLDRHGLSARPSGPGRGDDLLSAIDDLGFVQLDSVNTVARAHDMILWSRRQQYRPRALRNLHDRDRQLFEHWTHDAAMIPMSHFPHWRLKFARDSASLSRKWTDTRRDGFHARMDDVLRRISDHGPCTSADVGEGEARGSGGWWDWHPSKTALEYLWRRGDLSVVRRDGFVKVYDLTERVIPPDRVNARFHDVETIDWCCTSALDHLGFATASELKAFWDILTPPETRAWAAAALAEGRIIELDVEGHDGSLRRSYARPDVMDRQVAAPVQRLRILSPFDPALRDRKRAKRLFGFDYTIEIFVPAAKRTYGYYVFPVMEGDRMVGRIDMKAETKACVLTVTAFWPEARVRMGAGRRAALLQEIDRVARFAGCTRVDFAKDWMRN